MTIPSPAEERADIRTVDKIFAGADRRTVRLAALSTEGKAFFLEMDHARAALLHRALGRALDPVNAGARHD